MSDKIIRKKDVVRVIKPEIFVRCGYPMDIAEEAKKILNEDRNKIYEFIQSMESFKSSAFEPNSYVQASIEKIAQELAWFRCKYKGFGGRQRTIHTQERLEIKGEKFIVLSTKMVTTGTYIPESHYSDGWCSDQCYEPPELTNQKKHKIVELGSWHKSATYHQPFFIEAANVEKLPKELT